MNKQMRFSDEELALIKSTFAENHELLKAIRKVFIQYPLDIADKGLITQTFKGNKKLLDLMEKFFNPRIDPNAPINQVVDLWMSLDFKDKFPHDCYPLFESRSILIAYLDQQLKGLKDITEDKELKYEIVLSDLIKIEDKTAEECYANVLARNTAHSHVEQTLMQILILAGQKDETVEQTLEKLKKDSTK